MSMFQKATKSQLKARVALDGPSGSGKTFTALTWASVLGDRIAVVDTERGSASLYSDRFAFDTVRIAPPYDPVRLIEAFQAAEKEGYDAVIVDSLSHFWEGEGGFRDIADAAGQRAQGNSWAGWKTATPQLRHLIDTMLGADLHVIVTMRSKTEWTQEEYVDSKGKTRTRPVRIGMAPVMRAGTEYEFTIVGDLDIEHRLSISKSRCEPLADVVVQPGRAAEAAEQFKVWLASGEPTAPRNDIDALKARLNSIEDRDTRVAAKQAFAEQFGNPDFLLASKIGDAHAFIDGLGRPDDDPDGAPFGETEAAPAAEEVDQGPGDQVDNRAAGPSTTLSTDTSKKITAKQAQQLHRDLGRNVDQGGYGMPKSDQDDLIYIVVKGRTTHASELTVGEEALVRQFAGNIRDGRMSMGDVHRAAEEHRSNLEGQLEQSLAERGHDPVADWETATGNERRAS